MRVYPFSLLILIVCATGHGQSLVDPSLRVNKYIGGFDAPTGVAFLDANGTALVTEKNTGRVRLVENRAAGQALVS